MPGERSSRVTLVTRGPTGGIVDRQMPRLIRMFNAIRGHPHERARASRWRALGSRL